MADGHYIGEVGDEDYFSEEPGTETSTVAWLVAGALVLVALLTYQALTRQVAPTAPAMHLECAGTTNPDGTRNVDCHMVPDVPR